MFKKRKYNTILKIYRSVTLDEARTFDTEKLINVVLANLFCSEPTNYYITGPYPNNGWITKNGFLKAVQKKNYKDICQLSISSEKIHFSFTNWLLNDIKPQMKGYQDIEFYASNDIYDLYDFSDMEKFIKILHETVKAEPPFRNERLKGIYPISFINESIWGHNDFKKYILENNIGSLGTFCGDIKKWILKENEVEIAKMKLSESKIMRSEIK